MIHGFTDIRLKKITLVATSIIFDAASILNPYWDFRHIADTLDSPVYLLK